MCCAWVRIPRSLQAARRSVEGEGYTKELGRGNSSRSDDAPALRLRERTQRCRSPRSMCSAWLGGNSPPELALGLEDSSKQSSCAVRGRGVRGHAQATRRTVESSRTAGRQVLKVFAMKRRWTLSSLHTGQAAGQKRCGGTQGETLRQNSGTHARAGNWGPHCSSAASRVALTGHAARASRSLEKASRNASVPPRRLLCTVAKASHAAEARFQQSGTGVGSETHTSRKPEGMSRVSVSVDGLLVPMAA